ncbi:MAG: portal protein [Bacteroidales bacterium]|nr:portal protein [Bacteroidales bacterium]
MADPIKPTIFQRLQQTLTGHSSFTASPAGNTYTITQENNPVIDVAHSKEEYDRKLLQHQQAAMLAKQWVRSNYDIDNRSLAGLNEVRLMYRDCDLMDGFPEFGAALDITMEEVCASNEEGNVVKISSKSNRIKAILEDLFINRLSINVVLPMITRSVLKYGNDFMLLNITASDGVVGWKELPVYDIERYENGMEYPYTMTANSKSDKLEDTRFVWVGASQALSYKNFQVAHFRLLYDSQLMPYGVSFFNKARRHFRLLSMMEDAMLIYRIERSMERRVFKIPIGNIDPTSGEVEALVSEIASRFKRTPIIDDAGQLNLRKNLLSVSDDFFVPILPGQDYNPIETLPAGQNLTAMDDIKFIQNKILAALRVNKSLLNFEESTGDGKNLTQMDIRFTRTVNRVQQAILMELNKVAVVHLSLLGFDDDVTNFKLSMHNPSQQAEMLEVENLAKKITTAKDAVSDPGIGIPLMSLTYVWKHIFHWTDSEIKENLEQIRLENALAKELEKTEQIITRTKLFDPVDNIYGEPGAEYGQGAPGEESGGPGGAPGGGGGMPSFGGGIDFGEGEGPVEGMEGEMPIEQAAEEGAEGPEGPEMGENFNRRRDIGELINEIAPMDNGEVFRRLTEKMLQTHAIKKPETSIGAVPLVDKTFVINEELDNITRQLKLSHVNEGEVVEKTKRVKKAERVKDPVGKS